MFILRHIDETERDVTHANVPKTEVDDLVTDNKDIFRNCIAHFSKIYTNDNARVKFFLVVNVEVTNINIHSAPGYYLICIISK